MTYYEWREGSQHKVSAQVAGEVCAGLEQDGRLTAKDLVEVSKPEDAPLHDEFEWNDTEAAVQYRLAQARNVINSIRIVRGDDDDEREVGNVRAFFTLKRDEPQYESIQIILNDEEKYNELMKVAIRELMAFEKKYAKIKELGNVFDEIDSLVQITFPELAKK